MPDFTAAEIQDARENPRVGDVWERGTFRRCVSSIYDIGPFLCQKSVRGKIDWFGPTFKQFQAWTRNATLIRRGA